MRRATLLLTLTLLAGGCVSHHEDPGTVTFYWNFRDAQGRIAGDYSNANTGCDIAGVDTVQVTIDGGTYTSPCVSASGAPGIQLQNFLPGSYPFTIQALRADEVVFTRTDVIEARFNFDAVGDVTLDPVDPQGFVVYYNVANTTGSTPGRCVFNGLPVAGIIYRLEDVAGNPVSTTEVVAPGGGLTQQPVACDTNSFGILIPTLPLGAYRFRYLAAITPANEAIVQVCSYGVFHGGFPSIVPLSTATGVCP